MKNEKEKMTNDIWAIMKHMVCKDGVTLGQKHNIVKWNGLNYPNAIITAQG